MPYVGGTDADWQAYADRFRRLYVPAVCDVLDEHGLRFQSVSPEICALDDGSVVAGPAFTILGTGNAERDPSRRAGPTVIDNFSPGVVACYDTQQDATTGVWGELWTLGAQHRGCVGAVIDGGIRDTARIRSYSFPIFSKFRRPTDAVGRFSVADHACPINLGGVRVQPGDYIFGDSDGVVVIPSDHTLDVLVEAERLVSREDQIRQRIRSGERVSAVYRDFGKL